MKPETRERKVREAALKKSLTEELLSVMKKHDIKTYPVEVKCGYDKWTEEAVEFFIDHGQLCVFVRIESTTPTGTVRAPFKKPRTSWKPSQQATDEIYGILAKFGFTHDDSIQADNSYIYTFRHKEAV